MTRPCRDNEPLLLGIDLGTSSVKAGLFHPDGQLVAVENAHWPLRAPYPGWTEAEPERWRRAMRQALAKLPPQALARVKSVGVSALFPALLLLDEDGRPLRNAILYSDQRSGEQVEKIDRIFSIDRLQKLTANRVVPGTCTLASILWARENEPATIERAATIGHANTFLLKLLTGEPALDFGSASLSGLVEMGRDCYSPEICAAFDIDMKKLPPLVDSSAPVGKITPEASKSTGIPAGAVVAAGGGDALVGALGAGASDADDIFYVAGSSDCFTVRTDIAPRDLTFANCRFLLPGSYASIAATTTTGASLEWLGRNVLGFRGQCGERVMELAARSPAGANGVVFLPYLQGERAPLWNPNLRGVFTGLSAASGRDDMARAVLEGAVFTAKQALEATLQSFNPPSPRLLTVGGGARGELSLNTRAAVFGLPLEVLEFQDVTTLGAAMLGGLAAVIYASENEAIERTAPLRNIREIAPDKSLAGFYREHYKRFLAAQRIVISEPRC